MLRNKTFNLYTFFILFFFIFSIKFKLYKNVYKKDGRAIFFNSLFNWWNINNNICKWECTAWVNIVVE